tara:strand:+ start:128 stop:286 length:159 start_codon:yes stop_codon:yes gene_type:complete
MIGDASGLFGPTTNNVMASVAALGYYMAEKAAHLSALAQEGMIRGAETKKIR